MLGWLQTPVARAVMAALGRAASTQRGTRARVRVSRSLARALVAEGLHLVAEGETAPNIVAVAGTAELAVLTQEVLPGGVVVALSRGSATHPTAMAGAALQAGWSEIEQRSAGKMLITSGRIQARDL